MGRALVLRRKEVPDQDPDAYPAFYEQAMLHADQGRDAQARQIFEKIVAAAAKNRSWDQAPNLIAVYEGYAQVLRRTGGASEAAQYEARAGRIRANIAAASRQMEEILKKYPDPK